MEILKNKRNVIIFAFWIFLVSMLIGGYVAYHSGI